MAKMREIDPIAQELGKVLCERAGLEPEDVLLEFSVDDIGDNKVRAILQVPIVMSRVEFANLHRVATNRAQAR